MENKLNQLVLERTALCILLHDVCQQYASIAAYVVKLGILKDTNHKIKIIIEKGHNLPDVASIHEQIDVEIEKITKDYDEAVNLETEIYVSYQKLFKELEQVIIEENTIRERGSSE